MRDPPRGRPTRSSSSRYSRSDLSPTEHSSRTSETSPRYQITLDGLQRGTRRISATVKPTTRVGIIERAIRDHPDMEIEKSDTVILYRGDRLLLPSERLGNDSRPLQYHVFRDQSDTPTTYSPQVATTTSTHSGSGEEHVATLPLPRANSQELTTVAEVRRTYARRRGIEDANAIIIRLIGGLRPGPVEGDDWQLRKVAAWDPDDMIATILLQPSYIVLRGYGKEYLYQVSCHGEDGISVGGLKWWLRNRIIRCVHLTMNTRISVDIADILLSLDDVPLSRDTSVVKWTSKIEFTLSPAVEAAFTMEERWLCPSFDCFLCQETICSRAPTVSANCNHEPKVCAPCVRRWVSTCLVKDGWNRARCPECSVSLAYHEIKAHAPEDDFERYHPAPSPILRFERLVAPLTPK